MNKEDVMFFLEIIKAIASIGMPIIVAIFGTLLELRIRRIVVFAPKNGCYVKMNDFNIAARAAHAEMLGVE